MFRKFVVIPILCALLFGCMGPPIGSLAISVPDILSGVFSYAPGSQVIDPQGAIGLTAFFSYLYGYIPAFFTGIVAGFIVPRLHPYVFIITCGAIGFVLAFAFAATWDTYSNPFAYIPFWIIMKRMAFPGLLGGSVCGALTTISFTVLVRHAPQSA